VGIRIITGDRVIGSTTIDVTTIVEEESELFAISNSYQTRFAFSPSPIPTGANNAQTFAISDEYHTRFPITSSPIPTGANNAQTIEISVNYT